MPNEPPFSSSQPQRLDALMQNMVDSDAQRIIGLAHNTLDIESQAILGMKKTIGRSFVLAVRILLQATGRVVVMGMGITFLPALYVASEINDSDTLRVTDVAGVSMSRDHVLAWRRRSPARVFFRQLADAIRTIANAQFEGEVTLL